jgi:hypothetical protein
MASIARTNKLKKIHRSGRSTGQRPPLLQHWECKANNLGEAYALKATVSALPAIALSFFQAGHSLQLESNGTLQPVQCPVDDTVKLGAGLLHNLLAHELWKRQ